MIQKIILTKIWLGDKQFPISANMILAWERRLAATSKQWQGHITARRLSHNTDNTIFF
jgi:hypothetical protein